MNVVAMEFARVSQSKSLKCLIEELLSIYSQLWWCTNLLENDNLLKVILLWCLTFG